MPRWFRRAALSLALVGTISLAACTLMTDTDPRSAEELIPGTPFLDESDEVAVLPNYLGLEAISIHPETVRAQGSYPSGAIWLALGTLSDVEGLPAEAENQDMVCLIISNDELTAFDVGCSENAITLGAAPPRWGDVRYAARGWGDDEIDNGFARASKFVIYKT